MVRPAAAIVVLAALGGAAPAAAQTTLGGQRVGTSSGDFLKIGMGAKAVAMGEAFVAVADDPSALYWNPAGIAGFLNNAVLFSYTNWLTDVNVNYLAAVKPMKSLADGVVGVQVAGLHTELNETTELRPDGTGRSFSYSDLMIGVGYARYFTDKFAIGWNAKFLREDLGSEVGGGVVNAWLADIGTMYDIGFAGMTFAVALTNFGPELRADQGYSRVNRTGLFTSTQQTDYVGFAPPTTFKMGLSSRFYESEAMRGVGSIEMNRPGDNAETLKMGTELLFRNLLALRGGYDANHDELNFSGGVGVRLTVNQQVALFDYAFTDSDNFGRIDRLSFALEF